MSTNSVLITQSSDVTPSTVNTLTINLPINYSSYKKEIALQSLSLYFSWFNVTTTFNNTFFQYIFNGTTYSVSLPNGYYQVSDLNAYMQLQMFNNGQYLLDNVGNPVYFLTFTVNQVYYSITATATIIPVSLPSGYTNPNNISLSGTCPQIIIPATTANPGGNFGLLIGFNPQTWPSSISSTQQKNSDFTPQVSPVSSVNVCSNLANNSQFNPNPNIIYSFSVPSGSEFGGLISFTPTQLVWYRTNDQYVQQINISFLDQSGNVLQLNDKNVNCTLLLRDKI